MHEEIKYNKEGAIISKKTYYKNNADRTVYYFYNGALMDDCIFINNNLYSVRRDYSYDLPNKQR